jgi:hypothetical protein
MEFTTPLSDSIATEKWERDNVVYWKTNGKITAKIATEKCL